MPARLRPLLTVDQQVCPANRQRLAPRTTVARKVSMTRSVSRGRTHPGHGGSPPLPAAALDLVDHRRPS
ncbi:hypothetical protein LT493_22490 [Streptomyces tricolor]|nr:hypothetical protein [Streptomyces tricolor]